MTQAQAYQMAAQQQTLREYAEQQGLLRAKALDDCERAYAELQEAKKVYAEAIMAAHTYGAGNSAIARRVGLSETSIRTFIKRRKPHDD